MVEFLDSEIIDDKNLYFWHFCYQLSNF